MIQVQWTAASLEEARRIARQLVEKRLVACANLIPHVESIYRWKDKIETAEEVKVLLKTKAEHFSAVKTWIEQNSSYEVPEVSKIQFDEISSAYAKWVEEIT